MIKFLQKSSVANTLWDQLVCYKDYIFSATDVLIHNTAMKKVISSILQNKHGGNVGFYTANFIFDLRKSDVVFENI